MQTSEDPLDQVFTENDPSKVRAHIVMLTAALKSVKIGNPISVSDTNHLKRLKIFSNISILLTVGTDGDLWANRVNAVVGLVENDQITTAIFTRNTNVHDPQSDSLIIKRIIGVGNGKMLLEQWSNHIGLVRWSQHLTDLVSILEYCFQAKDRTGYPDGGIGFMHDFRCFIYSRSYTKIAARLNGGIRMWGSKTQLHPLQLIHQWYQNPSNSPPEPVTFTVPPAYLRSYLSKHGLVADIDQNIPLTAENVQQWSAVLSSIYDGVKFLHSFQRGSNVPSADQIEILWVYFRILQKLISLGVVEALITPGLATELVEKTITSNIDVKEEEEKEDVDIAQEEKKDSCKYLIRYLQTLTAWHTASRHVVSSVTCSTKQLHVFKVQSGTPRLDISEKDISCFWDNYARVASLSDKQKSQVMANHPIVLNVVETAAIHPEAALMALGCNPDSTLLQDIGGIFLADQVPIGTSRKCCWCCSTLEQLLRVAGATRSRYLLSGTHATIFPWAPPATLSEDILKGLRKKLLSTFYEEAQKKVVSPSSSQSLPTSETSDSDNEDDFDFRMMHLVDNISLVN